MAKCEDGLFSIQKSVTRCLHSEMKYKSLSSFQSHHSLSCSRILFRSSSGHLLVVRNRPDIMVLLTRRELRHLIHPHYFFNMILSFSFIVLRVIEPLCSYAFSSCEMDHVSWMSVNLLSHLSLLSSLSFTPAFFFILNFILFFVLNFLLFFILCF